MDILERKFIDWDKTSKNLKLLRCDNIDLRRYVCKTIKTRSEDCDGTNCDSCKYDMDPTISQSELAIVFNVSESMVANWENGRSTPSLDDLIYYAQICKMDLFEIVIFRD